MDALSEVLGTVRVTGAVYLAGEMTAPWSVIGQVDSALCAAYLPRSERVVSYHLVTEGSCWGRLADDPASAIHAEAGELLVVPQGETYILASAPDLSPVPFAPLLADQVETRRGEVMTLCYGGGGAMTRLVCGFLACDDALSNPLVCALPRIFKVDMRGDSRSTWLKTSLQLAASEAAQRSAGGAIYLTRLSELLLVQAVRKSMDTLPAERAGWLAGLRDRFVGKALSMLHAQPGRGWTVDELAREVGLSRSALAQRFSALVGEPPMQYLTRWRLRLAARELVSGTAPLVAIASRAGYESEAAFSRAFKREFGQPPAAWRRTRPEARVAQPGAAPEAA